MKKVLLIDSYSKVLKNRFEVCVMASERAKAILFGNSSFGPTSKKEVCTALEEMRDEKIDFDSIKQNMIKNHSQENVADSAFLDVSGALQDGSDDHVPNIELDFDMFADQNIQE
jgi:DNA-directed RNA polymerase subunit K/omega